jgi:hypothetical protein
MEPPRPVATNVDVVAGYDFNVLSRSEVNLAVGCSLVVPSHKLWVIAAFFGCSILARGTSVVALVTADSVIIATDSVETVVTNGVKSFTTVCKIHKDGETFYSVAGDYGTPGTKTDIWSIAESAVEASKTTAGIFDVVEPAIFKIIPDILSVNKRFDPATYARWLRGDPVIELVFASFENDGPVALGLSFSIDSLGIPQHADPHILRAVEGSVNTARLGQHVAMESAITSTAWHSKFLSDPIGASQELIQVEIDAAQMDGRKDVGPPIPILRITKSGGDFVPEHRGICP